MEEILASIRRIIEDSDGAGPAPHANEPPLSVVQTRPAEVEIATEASDKGDEVTFRAEFQDAGERIEAAPAPSQISVGAEVHQLGSRGGDAVAAPAYLRPVERVEAAEPLTKEEPAPRPAIISEQAGRQVAAAFGELSEAFAASRRKSFDEMAEEMMRPMLQDWLDNNLPVLVERLVREEIERVARGTER